MDRELFFQLLRGAVPGGVAGALLILAFFWRNRPDAEGTTSKRVIVALVTLGALLIAAFAIAFPLRVPSSLFDWFGWIPVVLTMIGIGVALAPWRVAAGVIGLFGVLIGMCFAPASAWSSADLKSIGLAVALCVGCAAFTHPVWRQRPMLLLIVSMMAAGGMSQVLVLGFHALKLGQAAGIGASMLGGMAAGMLIVHLRQRVVPAVLPLVSMAVLFSAAALAQGPVVTETKFDWALVLLLASVPGAATGAVWLMQRKGVIAQWITTLILAGGPIVVAMGIVLATRSASTSGY
jgi:hypothetical protein